MLRGSTSARIDDKGRLKVPNAFRRLVEEKHGREVFLTSLGKIGALADDGGGNLLALDDSTGKLLKINPKNLDIAVIAQDLPVGYTTIGGYPVLEFPYPLTVSPEGDIYIPTANRGLLMLDKHKSPF